MTTPLSISTGDPSRPSPSHPPAGLPSAAAQPNGVARPPQQQPRQNAAFNPANLTLPPGVNGFNGNVSDQARLAMAQQAIQGFQANGGGPSGPGGMTMANAAALLGNGQGQNSEAILRQVSRALPCSGNRNSRSVASFTTIFIADGTATNNGTGSAKWPELKQ